MEFAYLAVLNQVHSLSISWLRTLPGFQRGGRPFHAITVNFTLSNSWYGTRFTALSGVRSKVINLRGQVRFISAISSLGAKFELFSTRLEGKKALSYILSGTPDNNTMPTISMFYGIVIYLYGPLTISMGSGLTAAALSAIFPRNISSTL